MSGGVRDHGLSLDEIYAWIDRPEFGLIVPRCLSDGKGGMRPASVGEVELMRLEARERARAYARWRVEAFESEGCASRYQLK